MPHASGVGVVFEVLFDLSLSLCSPAHHLICFVCLCRVGVNIVQGLVSSSGAGDILVEFGEYSLQVGVVEVTRNIKAASGV